MSEEPSVPTADPSAPRVPGYDILHEIGRGGMGVVWEALDHRLDRRVALKVQHAGGSGTEASAASAASAQIRTEARLAARITHPGVVPVHDAGVTADGAPYYTMELVSGSGLDALIDEGPLTEARALGFVVQLAGAVAAAHELGIVHRDLKPANVLVDPSGHLRILDFGLARRWRLAEDDEGIEGTLEYMSLDQLVGQAPSPTHDLYALGVILYEMLTCRLPYGGAGVIALIARHTDAPPPPPSTWRPDLSSDLELLCLRCLDPDATRRPSARLLGEAAQALLAGKPLASVLLDGAPPAPHVPRSLVPAAPPAQLSAQGAVRHAWSWHVAAAPSALWPMVANTDRFNKAAGLPPVEYDDAGSDGSGSRRGRTRALGFELEWDEHPFEWVQGQEHAVFRRYTRGPIAAVWNRVALTPREDGSTDLLHEVRVLPRGALGRVASEIQLGWLLRRRAERVYRRIEAAARADAAHAADAADPADPFEERHEPDETVRLRVASLASRLTRRADAKPDTALGFPSRLVMRLATLLLHGPDKAVERLRPYALADTWEERREEVLDLMLHAVNAGLLEIAWDLVCPVCAQPRASVASLAGVSSTGTCTSCRTTYAEDLVDTVELTFRAPPAIRPTTLARYCVGSPAARPHVLAQQMLAPGESRSVRVRLAAGEHRIAGPGLAPWELTASASGFGDTCILHIKGGALSAPTHVVRAGDVTLELTNLGPEPALLRVETLAHRRDGVTAAAALAHPTLRELVSVALLPEGEHVSVARLAFLFVAIAEPLRLFDTLGDPGALELVRRLDALIERACTAHLGAVFEGSVERVIATFPHAGAAVSAALALASSLEELPAPLRGSVRIAVHEGRCIALARGTRPAYFGETLLAGVALLAAAEPGTVLVSGAAADDPGAVSTIYAAGWTRRTLPGAGRRIVLAPPGHADADPPSSP